MNFKFEILKEPFYRNLKGVLNRKLKEHLKATFKTNFTIEI